jgi:hypothetical protein
VLAVTVVALDGLLLAGNLLHVRADDRGAADGSFFADHAWAGNRDGSYIELFGHLQLALAIVGLLVLWLRTRAPVYGVWALVFGTLIADDFLRLHERGGAALARTLRLPEAGGLRPQDLGEPGIWLIFGLVLGPALLLAHLRAQGTARRHSWALIYLVLALVVIALVLDLSHYVAVEWFPTAVGRALTFAETAAELGVMTLMLLAVHRMAWPSTGLRRR